MAGAIILEVMYGLEIDSRDDPALVIAEEAVYAFSETADAGSYLGMSHRILLDMGVQL